MRSRNAEWLRPWEATSPVPYDEPPPTYAAMVRRLRAEARAGRSLPFAVTYEGQLVGQLTVGGIVWGSLRTAFIGYWVDEDVAGRGVMPTAVALAVDHCIGTVGLHRVEINIRPENEASLRVVEKLGFRDEGLRRALPAHRRRLARPPHLRAVRRGPARRAVSSPTGERSASALTLIAAIRVNPRYRRCSVERVRVCDQCGDTPVTLRGPAHERP